MNAEEYSKRGDTYFSERNFDKAIAEFSETIKLEPNNPFAYYKRGVSYTNKKEFDLAIADFTAAINIEPDKFGNFYFDRALAYTSRGNKDSAVSDIEKAIKIDPENKDYREAISDIKSASGNTNSNSSSADEKTVRAIAIEDEIKFIVIRGIIGAVITFVIFAVATRYGPTDIGMSIMCAWAGFGVAGNLPLLVFFFKEGFNLFGFLEYLGWDSGESFGGNLIPLLFHIFLGFMLAYFAFAAFSFAGPVWPLVRILMKKNQIKYMK